MFVLFCLFALTLAKSGYYFTEGGAGTDQDKKWKNWQYITCPDIPPPIPPPATKRDGETTPDPCATAVIAIEESNGVYKFNKEHFVVQNNWPSNTITAQAGHKIEITFDIEESADFYLKGGSADNKTTFNFIMPENGKEYGIAFQGNDGMLNDVGIKFLKSTGTATQTKIYIKSGNNYQGSTLVHYTNPIKYNIEYEVSGTETIDFAKYKNAIWQTTNKFALKFNNLSIQENVDLQTNIGYNKDIGTELPQISETGYVFTVTTLADANDWLHEIKVKKGTTTPATCTANFGANYKFVINENYHMAYPVKECVNIIDAEKNTTTKNVKIIPCTENSVKIEKCGENSAGEIKSISEYGFKYITELPKHIAYSTPFTQQQCKGEEMKGPIALARDGCVKYKTNGGYVYIRAVLSGNEMVQSVYTDDKCSNDKKLGDDQKTACGSCGSDNSKLYCHEYGKAPGSGSTNSTTGGSTGTCKAGFGTQYKYLIGPGSSNLQEFNIAHKINVTDSRTKYYPCNETHYKYIRENGEPSYFNLTESRMTYCESLPAHVAYGSMYEGGDCQETSILKSDYLLFEKKCHKIDDRRSSQYIVDGNKVVQVYYTSKSDCTGEKSTGLTMECDKCFSQGPMKPVCHEVGGKPNGAMSTLVLLVIAFIFFLF